MRRPFGATDADIGSLFARDATNAVRHAAALTKTRELIDNLNAALESRSVIGAAVGIIMSRDHLSMTDAFEKLAEISQEENMKLRDVAQRITGIYETDVEPHTRPES
jgi:AmiR/NasT family two-component response regulator